MNTTFHPAHANLLKHPWVIHLIGCGGNGSQVLNRLARLHICMKSSGHPHGLDVTVFDPDIVTPANVGRGIFYPADVDYPKAAVLVNRINLTFGLGWRSREIDYGEKSPLGGLPTLVIGCVDTAEARRKICRRLMTYQKCV